MVCKNCGAQLPEGSLFCNRCGFSTAVYTGNLQTEILLPKSKRYISNKKIACIVVAILLTLIFAVVAIGIDNRYNGGEKFAVTEEVFLSYYTSYSYTIEKNGIANTTIGIDDTIRIDVEYAPRGNEIKSVEIRCELDSAFPSLTVPELKKYVQEAETAMRILVPSCDKETLDAIATSIQNEYFERKDGRSSFSSKHVMGFVLKGDGYMCVYFLPT